MRNLGDYGYTCNPHDDYDYACYREHFATQGFPALSMGKHLQCMIKLAGLQNYLDLSLHSVTSA